jgi:vacuolar protein sorting-associated protein 11
LSHLAIGLGDGTVHLYRHLDQSLFSGFTSLTAIPKPRTVHESLTEPITGLGFKEVTDEFLNLYLFVVTINRVLSFQASGKVSGGPPTIADEVGCALGCVTMDWRAKDIVVARDEAIYIYVAQMAVVRVTRTKVRPTKIFPWHKL